MSLERRRHQPKLDREATGAGFSLVELLVTMVILLVVVSILATIYGPLASQSTNTTDFSQNQGRARNVLRVLEADLRSADPLLLVPSSFTADPNGSSNSGTYGTGPTDIIAMYETNDRYSPCPVQAVTSTSAAVPTPFEQQPFAANVIWAFDPGPGADTGTLVRYSYCPQSSPAWSPGIDLRDVVNAGGTMFSLSQGTTPPSQQLPTPSSTTIPNQTSPACGSVMNVFLTLSSRGERTPFILRVAVDLPNQGAVQPGACQ